MRRYIAIALLEIAPTLHSQKIDAPHSCHKRRTSMARALALSLLLLITSFAAAAPLTTLVIPNAQTSTAGNGMNNLPGTPGSYEFQEVFGRGQFSSVSGAILIQQIAFRASPNTGPISVTDTSINISLSTSSFAPNSIGSNTLITSNYAANIGPDNTLVYSAGAGTLLSSPGCTGSGPCAFDMIFNFSTPFLYDPANGWLLMDIHVTGFNAASGALDAESFSSPGGSVAQVGSSDQVDLGGPIVQLGYTATPEPSSLLLLGTGALGFLGPIRKKLVPHR